MFFNNLYVYLYCETDMKSLLVTTWGNPWIPGWKEVEYSLNNYTMKSKSSLPLLLHKIEKSGKTPSKILIIVLDTVADHPTPTYGELLESVKNKFLTFIREDLHLDTKYIEVIVAPGVGRFHICRSDKYQVSEFLGELSDFYIYVLMKLANEISPDELELHLDLTHGINYMPVLVYRAIKEILGILAISNNVRLKVYNAEPFIGDVNTSLRIHVVEDTSIAPAPCNEAISLNMNFLKPSRLPQLELSPSDQRKINEEMKRSLRELEIRKLNAFLGAVLNGLPLMVYTFYPEYQKLEMCLSSIEDIYNTQVKISTTENGFRVIRRLRFGSDLAVLVKCYFTAKVLGLESKSEVSIKELHTLRERFFSRNNKINATISYDLTYIEEIVSQMDVSRRDQLTSWISLSKVCGEGEPDISKFNDRNFLAHSGFERNVTYIKLKNDLRSEYDLRESIMLKYCNEKDVQRRIIDASIKGLTHS